MGLEIGGRDWRLVGRHELKGEQGLGWSEVCVAYLYSTAGSDHLEWIHELRLLPQYHAPTLRKDLGLRRVSMDEEELDHLLSHLQVSPSNPTHTVSNTPPYPYPYLFLTLPPSHTHTLTLPLPIPIPLSLMLPLPPYPW